MYIFLVVLHVILCILLVLIILLQPGKGGDVGAAFGGGGGGGGMFGPRGPATLLSRATTGVAVTFMVTSILLALPWEEGDGDVEGILSSEEESENTGALELLEKEDQGEDEAGAGADGKGE